MTMMRSLGQLRRRGERPSSRSLARCRKGSRWSSSNQVYIDRSTLPPALVNRLIRLAAFQNPEFYAAQAMRLPTFGKPRVISCAELFAKHIALPRGCFDAAIDLLTTIGIRPELRDERFSGTPIGTRFLGTLTKEQQTAVDALMRTRHRRTRSHYRFREDRGRRQADSGTKHQHIGLGAPAAIVGSMGGAATCIPRHRRGPCRGHPWRQETADGRDRCRHHPKLGEKGGGIRSRGGLRSTRRG